VFRNSIAAGSRPIVAMPKSGIAEEEGGALEHAASMGESSRRHNGLPLARADIWGIGARLKR
jgi:hypothetical protein